MKHAELDDPFLNIAAFRPEVRTAGPGRRAVVWLQGCPLRCEGCVNPDYLAFESKSRTSIRTLARRIRLSSRIEGVTFSGGEPTSQPQGIARLSETVHEARLTTVCYTGFTIEELQARHDPWIDRLLHATDILIDGPFIKALAVNLPWRGSANQRVHFLSNAYRHLEEQASRPEARVEFIVGDGAFGTVGNWPEGMMQRLSQILSQD